MSACEVETGLILKSLPLPLTSSCPQHICFAACATFKFCASAELQMAACFGFFGCLQIAILLSQVLKCGRSPVVAGEGKRPELGESEIWFPVVALSN